MATKKIAVIGLAEILTSKSGNFTAEQYASATVQIAGATYGLSARMATHVKDFDKTALRAFNRTYYKAIKADAADAGLDVPKAYNRAKNIWAEVMDKLDPERVAKRNASKAAKTGAVTPNPKGDAKDKPIGDAAILKRFGQLATSFLSAEDKLVATRLIAAISNGIKLATVSKK